MREGGRRGAHGGFGRQGRAGPGRTGLGWAGLGWAGPLRGSKNPRRARTTKWN
jgi:hypothetical protein